MKEEIKKRFFDEDSVKMAIKLVSKTDLNNVEVSHLYALLNGVPASEINKTRGAGGMVYYGLVYRDFKAKKGSRHSINRVFSAFNKRYGTNISVWDIKEIGTKALESEDEYKFFPFDEATNYEGLLIAYNELVKNYRKLKEEFLLTSSLLKRTQAELDVVTAEKEVLEANKEKMKAVFLKGK